MGRTGRAALGFGGNIFLRFIVLSFLIPFYMFWWTLKGTYLVIRTMAQEISAIRARRRAANLRERTLPQAHYSNRR